MASVPARPSRIVTSTAGTAAVSRAISPPRRSSDTAIIPAADNAMLASAPMWMRRANAPITHGTAARSRVSFRAPAPVGRTDSAPERLYPVDRDAQRVVVGGRRAELELERPVPLAQLERADAPAQRVLRPRRERAPVAEHRDLGGRAREARDAQARGQGSTDVDGGAEPCAVLGPAERRGALAARAVALPAAAKAVGERLVAGAQVDEQVRATPGENQGQQARREEGHEQQAGGAARQGEHGPTELSMGRTDLARAGPYAPNSLGRLGFLC